MRKSYQIDELGLNKKITRRDFIYISAAAVAGTGSAARSEFTALAFGPVAAGGAAAAGRPARGPCRPGCP